MMKRLTLIVLIPFFFACNESETPETPSDNFDRAAMLINWSDNIIIPSYQAYAGALNELKLAKDEFLADPQTEKLQTLRSKWEIAYLAWQNVSMFEIGKAEELSLRDYSNIFPTNPDKIEDAITTLNYNLELPSSRDMQGFPALDYMLFGMDEDPDSLVGKLKQSGYAQYLSDIVDRLVDLGNMVLADWENGYRNKFIENTGSGSNASVNKLVNDYMYYYEKELRAGKIGIPAGVFSNSPRKDLVEGLYNRSISKRLCLEALDAVIAFYNGHHFQSSEKGESLKSYLDYLNAISQSETLSDVIATQFVSTRETIATLDDDFYAQIESDNSEMLKVYDQLQSNVILMKVDMFQAMNIRVDYVDADGD